MKVGIPKRELITNGLWAKETKRIERIANTLVRSGVNDVHISVDCFHQEFIPLRIVRRTAETLMEAGMTCVCWNPCWVVSRDDDNKYNRETKATLEKLSDLPVETGIGNTVRPEGRALVCLTDFFPPKTRMPEGKCGDVPYTEPLDSIRTVCVEPDGRIAVCKGIHVGNVYGRDMVDIIENYDPFKIPEAEAIVEKGMEGLIEWARQRNVMPDPGGYYDVCHLCNDLRRRVNAMQ
jgi:hypothetical protein